MSSRDAIAIGLILLVVAGAIWIRNQTEAAGDEATSTPGEISVPSSSLSVLEMAVSAGGGP